MRSHPVRMVIGDATVHEQKNTGKELSLRMGETWGVWG